VEAGVIPKAPTNRSELVRLLKQGEGRTLEFKRSTGELREGMQAVCAFLNGSGGIVLFGVRPDGHPEGQQVSDQTLRDIAQALDKFEPPVNLPVDRLPVAEGKVILILRVDGTPDSVPFTFEGRPYERVSSTTRKMSQDRYERLLLDRGHAKRRWENLPADGLTLKDLDRKAILRTRELAIQQNRISPDTSRDIGEIVDRMGLRVAGVLTQAAQVLYGKRFMPDYPQCLLKMGRFRGATVTGEIVDNRQEHMNAFAMVREGMAFLERTMPLGARFPEGQIFREDRFPVPPNALREILLNAVMHRDYSHYSGYVAIAIFDDRIEVQSYGRLPSGVKIAHLSGPHLSKPTNPLIAEAFHRTGAVEVWGRGTNRVIEMCQQHGAPPPVFEEKQGFVVVTFRAPLVVGGAGSSSGAESGDQVGTKSGPSRYQVEILRLCREARPLVAMMEVVGRQNRTKFRDGLLKPLIEAAWLELTIADKPRSRMQRYKTTGAGLAMLEKERHGEP
jgi:ATP-dependent DNA helicase RecG